MKEDFLNNTLFMLTCKHGKYMSTSAILYVE
jgi:hypothetical protein